MPPFSLALLVLGQVVWLLFSPPGSTTAARIQVSETTGNDVSSKGKKLSKSQQLKKIFQKYHVDGVLLHIGISLTNLGIFYMVISCGVDMYVVMFKLGFKESLIQSKKAAGTEPLL
ncbi:Protein FAM210B [Sciurus carolinensis]|uniref:Protein FAM210B n=1 Tax=Sciurus carolinensis TaxID=30640 RepID=A0AA41MTJ7_SCICA|nr:Protein FAM210B [Sciurus carolinensis]